MQRIENAGTAANALAVFLLLLPAAGSCGLRELGEIAPQPPVPDYIVDVEESEPVTVVTGVEYPEGYDWNSWGASGMGTPSLVVFRDGKKTLSLPVGRDRLVSEDIDMHRYVDGHLYTDFSTDSETVISCDGAELFRYSGRERIVFLAVRDGHVLTLGESRDGQGFSSRSDGVPLFLGMTGTVYQNAGLSPEGELRFFYRMRVNSTAGCLWQYYAVTGAENVKIELPSDVTEVFGLAFSDDAVASGESVSAAGGGTAVLCRWKNGSGKSSLGIVRCGAETSRSSMTYLSRVSNGAVLGNSEPVISSFVGVGILGARHITMYSGTSIRLLWYSDAVPVGFRHVADSLVGVRKSISGGREDILCRGAVRDTLPEGYTVMSGDALCVRDDGISIGMTSMTGGRAILWDGGDIDTLGFRGIVTGVYLEKPADGDAGQKSYGLADNRRHAD